MKGVLIAITFSLLASGAFAKEQKGPTPGQKEDALFSALDSQRTKGGGDLLYFLNARCEANCGGSSVSCSGEICVAIDGVGVGCGDIENDENDDIRVCGAVS